MDLAESLKLLNETAAAAAEATAKVEVITLKDDPRNVLIKHGKSLDNRAVPSPLRKHTVASIEDLIALTARVSGNAPLADDDGEHQPVIWITADNITLVWDDADRREFATLALGISEPWAKLRELAGGKCAADQKAVLRMLKFDFRNCLQQVELIPALSKINFRKNVEGYGDIQHGKESMGRQIASEVAGVGEIAEAFDVICPIYKEPLDAACKAQVSLSLEIDAEAQRFRVQPFPGELEQGEWFAVSSLRERIREGVGENVPVYLGKP